MKSKSNKRLISFKLFFHLEIEHSQQLTSIIFVVPDTNSAVQLTASCYQRTLFADIHTSDAVVMESFVQILEDDFFITYVA